MLKNLWHSFEVKIVFENLKSSNSGLVLEDVNKRILRYGKNELPKEKSGGWFKVLISQFTSPLIVILIIAAVASYFFHEFVDAGVIVAAIVIGVLITYLGGARKK